ncbi:MAG: MlaD family protein [Pyrinomonadaceae bacterium]
MPPAKKTIGLRELRVGLFVIIAIALLIFLILNASGDISFARKIRLKAQFLTAEGLRPGGEVRLAGVRIGKVDEVRLLTPTDNPKDPKVEAVLALDSKIDGKPITDLVRTDSTAQLATPSLLGSDRIINITPGTSLGNPVQEGHELRTTTEGGMAQLTASGNELVDQLNQLSTQVTDITRKVNEGQGSLGRFVNDEAFYDNLNVTIRETQGVIRQLRSSNGTAGRLINDPALYNNVTAISAQLQGIAEGLRAGRGTAGKLLTDEALYNDARAAIARFNTSAERIDNIIAGIQRGEGTAGKLLTDEQLYNNVNQLSSESVKLLYDFRQNPKKYLTIKFSIF